MMISVKNLLKTWKPQNGGEYMHIAMAALMILVIAMTLLYGGTRPQPSLAENEPEAEPQGSARILVLREEMVKDPRFGYVVVVDYTVNGMCTNALFRPGEEEKYERFWDELDKLGEVVR